ncbi:MAG: asparagine synthase C-terminal domain-containing protein [Candidatus Micrarchaeota archaeon]|nr:asparagine synthase C-terminal domain-containing protein [Candidatus Micrarchaeota archaeon]
MIPRGIDSTLIAVVAGKCAKSMKLVTIGTEESEDVKYAEEIGKEIGMIPEIHLLESQEMIMLFGEACMMVDGGFVKTEILAPVLKLLKIAKQENRIILFGSAAEELFAGYQRHYEWIGKDWSEIRESLSEEYRNLDEKGDIANVKKMAKELGCKVDFPFYDISIKKIAHEEIGMEEHFSDSDKKKPVLRKAASILGLPTMAIERKKKALQYGSGVERYYTKNRDMLEKLFPECNLKGRK